jgi:hypothetical protein
MSHPLDRIREFRIHRAARLIDKLLHKLKRVRRRQLKREVMSGILPVDEAVTEAMRHE